METYLGTIMMFGFNFAPRGWALCDGQLMAISQNTALFSLIGTTYGGDGRTTFALPDLRGRVPLKFGSGPGLSGYQMGQASGTENVTLSLNQMPAHNHTLSAANIEGDDTNPTIASAFGISQNDMYIEEPQTGTLRNNIMSVVGGSQPHTNMQPFLSVNFCIALEGIFPPRP